MIKYIGKITRREVNDLYGKSRLGLLLYQPAHNHFEAQPIKMFEYMAAGLPFIASNFPLWQKIVNESNSGICVDCGDASAVNEAINKIINNPELAQEMGIRGRNAVEKNYNWISEEYKLIDLYNEIVD